MNDVRQPGLRGTLLIAVLTAIALSAAAGAFALWIAGGGSRQPQASPNGSLAPADPAQLADAAERLVRATGSDEPLPPIPFLPAEPRGLAYAALRVEGERLADAWAEGDTPEDALRAAIIEARSALDGEERTRVDVVEVSLAGRELDSGPVDEPIGENLERGVVGMSLELEDGSTVHVPPTQMLADNRSFDSVVNQLVDDGRQPRRVTLFEATQALIDLDAASVVRLERGNVLVPASQLTAGSVRGLADGMATWLTTQLGDDGRMVYEYWPSRGEESDSNNMIRQWMATLALTRVADVRSEVGLYDRVADNIDYNLDLSYTEVGGLGHIADPDGDVKLGAIALAALAISRHPDRDRWATEEAALRSSVDELWNEDGSFTSFLVPEGRNDNQNFYPGEALLLWAATLEENPDDSLLARFMKSFEYYRQWHREQRNPAFIPWHTMAYEKVWRITDNEDLREFIFEMNDWLLALQQWDEAPTPDVAGRFYDPDHPEYGPPHASSDGVYLEGLIAAYRVAEESGDVERSERYRVAIARTLRHLMQLQFADEIDMYYVSRRERVEGGLRTTEYDNRIRVDNVQHGLLGVLDVLETFSDGDFAITDP